MVLIVFCEFLICWVTSEFKHPIKKRLLLICQPVVEKADIQFVLSGLLEMWGNECSGLPAWNSNDLLFWRIDIVDLNLVLRHTPCQNEYRTPLEYRMKTMTFVLLWEFWSHCTILYILHYHECSRNRTWEIGGILEFTSHRRWEALCKKGNKNNNSNNDNNKLVLPLLLRGVPKFKSSWLLTWSTTICILSMHWFSLSCISEIASTKIKPKCDLGNVDKINFIW